MAGGIARALRQAGLERGEAERWQERIEQGAILVGAHIDETAVSTVHSTFRRNGAASIAEATWDD